jgi:hypothetical protein
MTLMHFFHKNHYEKIMYVTTSLSSYTNFIGYNYNYN